MADTPETSPETSPEVSSEKPKKKVITVGMDRLKGDDEGERRGGKGRRGGRGRDRDERDRPPAVPPALMRGPKPKPKASEDEAPAAEAEDAAVEEATAVADAEPITEEAAS